MHKIIPLVLFVSVSLIIGNQVAFAETNVWAFYGEVGGSTIDATNPGNGDTPPLSSTTGIAGVPSTFQITDGVEEYENIANANMPGKSGPMLVAKCFEGIPNPTSGADFIFGDGNALPFQCVQNQRAAQDLGIGVDQIVINQAQPLFQPLEVGEGQLVVIDLTAILPTNPTNPHTNFMFRISSNSGNEQAWVAVSDEPPSGTISFGDFTPLGTGGFFTGGDAGSPNNDSYISFIPKNFLYFTQTIDRQDILLQQIKADKIERFIGGELIPLDTTMVLLGATKTTASWMIPVLVSAIGIGIVIARKF